MRIQRHCHCEDETIALAARLGGRLSGGDLVCLDGPLGCGKTRFVQGLAAGLGLDPSAVCSPSFIICREYHNQTPLTLTHVDAFRLTGAQDLPAIGWDELLCSTDTVIAVEWSSRIRSALPRNRIDVQMEHTGETSRMITLAAPDNLSSRFDRLVD